MPASVSDADRDTPTRLLPLEGGRNFRDLGGYRTSDGRSTRWRMLLRSGTMARLTAADHDYLRGLGIRTICDFRATPERVAEPIELRTEPAFTYLSWDYTLDENQIMGAFRLGIPSPDKVREAITGFYRSAPNDFAERFASMFRQLQAGEVPLVFKCSAGKDRTGVAAAILLSALGVPRDTVVADYALSDQIVNYEKALASDRERNGPRNKHNDYLHQLPRDVLLPMLASEPRYIEATLDQIAADHGSVVNYVERRLGVDARALDALRARYLE